MQGVATGVLVAVSIPIFTAQLRKSRVATDQANARAAKAAFVAYWLDDTADTSATLHYNAGTGIAEVGSYTGSAYGKTTDPTDSDSIEGATSGTTLSGKHVTGTYNSASNSVTLAWAGAAAASTTP